MAGRHNPQLNPLGIPTLSWYTTRGAGAEGSCTTDDGLDDINVPNAPRYDVAF